jgi:RNA polymerase sigma factor (TIGR02999 family)
VTEVTRILESMERGDPAATERLLPLVYDELRRLAAAWLMREKPGQTLQATALVHEAYLRLVGGEQPREWNGRGHFFGAAAEAMRRILLDAARRKHRLKAGGNRRRVDLEGLEPSVLPRDLDLLALDEALQQLEREEPRKAALVKLRFFAGLPNDEAAEALGVSSATAENDWAYARAWLRLHLGGAPEVRRKPGPEGGPPQGG